MHIFAAGIEVWCNGSTRDFGSLCPGSNPGISTKPALEQAFLYNKTGSEYLNRSYLFYDVVITPTR